MTPVGGPRRGATVELDGHAVFYEMEGTGRPIVLLHGGLAANDGWAAQFAGFSPVRTVVAPERQGHGHTPDRDGPLTYQGMAAETAAFLRALDLAPADLVGWSDGGMVGLLVAIEEPELVRTLTCYGSGFSSAGYVPGAVEDLVARPADDEELAWMADAYRAVSPDGPEHFASVWEKIRTLWAEPFDWSDRLDRVAAPVLVLVGDDDFVTVSHADEFARRLPDGRLAVLPGASHLVAVEQPELFNRIVLSFTDEPAVRTLEPIRRRPTASP